MPPDTVAAETTGSGSIVRRAAERRPRAEHPREAEHAEARRQVWRSIWRRSSAADDINSAFGRHTPGSTRVARPLPVPADAVPATSASATTVAEPG